MIFPLLLACAVKATALFGAAWLSAWIARRQPAALRSLVWGLSALAALALPALELALPRMPSPGLNFAMPHLAASPPAARVFSVTVAAEPGPHPSWAALLFSLWALGFFLAAARLATGWVRLMMVARGANRIASERVHDSLSRCSRQLGLRRPVRLLHSGGKETPCTWGLLRPSILLPVASADWPAERLEVVLTHELAHIGRFDWLRLCLAEAARALYWFHPLAWLALRRLRHESERACDDAVLSAGKDPISYANELLQMIRESRAPGRSLATALAIAEPSRTRCTTLERRITAMLDTKINRRRTTRNAALLSTAAALLVLLPLAAIRLPAQIGSSALAGTVTDTRGGPISSATVIVTNRFAHTRDMTATDSTGAFRFSPLNFGDYELRVLKPGFAGFSAGSISINTGRESVQNIRLDVQAFPQPMENPAPIRVKNTSARPGGLIYKVNPAYPASAKTAGIEGTVLLTIVIGSDGSPSSIQVTDPIDPDLARAAVEAVNRWRFRPTLLNGQPVAIQADIEVRFTLLP